ncbi:MAG: hypothetical protein JWR69_866 [Pedosphaera sp.]|nr:hypothetical protein [Pedosphaera sp.]
MQQAILGKWLELRSEQPESTLQFLADGRMVSVDRGTLVAKYVFVADHRIKVTRNRSGAPSQWVVLQIWIEKGVLILKYPGGRIEQYRRLS